MTYSLPFIAAGTIAALLIAAASPSRKLTTIEDDAASESNRPPDLVSIPRFFYALVGGLLVLILAAYVI